MTLFATDAQRDLAAAIKVLLARIEIGHGEDRALGADIIDVVDAPRSIGNPTWEFDAAFTLATWLQQDPVAVVSSVFREKQSRCTRDQLARMLCATILRVHLANLERAPA